MARGVYLTFMDAHLMKHVLTRQAFEECLEKKTERCREASQ